MPKTTTKATPLTDREKRILVTLRKNGVESKLLSSAFGVKTMTIAGLCAQATRGNGCFAS